MGIGNIKSESPQMHPVAVSTPRETRPLKRCSSPHSRHLFLSAFKYHSQVHSNLEDPRAAKSLKKPTQTLHLDVEREQESKQGCPHQRAEERNSDHGDQPVYITLSQGHGLRAGGSDTWSRAGNSPCRH